MKAALLIILWTSTCLHHTGADLTDVPVYSNIDVQKLAETWYRIAVALKNREPVNAIPFDDVVEPTKDGDLVLKMRYIQDGMCQKTDVSVVHTSEPGVFKVPATGETVYMVDADYESYHIVHVERNDSYGLYLLSRTRGTSDDVKTKFRAFAETLGFDEDQIINVILADKCP